MEENGRYFVEMGEMNDISDNVAIEEMEDLCNGRQMKTYKI
jgi:hypothetical protein